MEVFRYDTSISTDTRKCRLEKIRQTIAPTYAAFAIRYRARVQDPQATGKPRFFKDMKTSLLSCGPANIFRFFFVDAPLPLICVDKMILL